MGSSATSAGAGLDEGIPVGTRGAAVLEEAGSVFTVASADGVLVGESRGNARSSVGSAGGKSVNIASSVSGGSEGYIKYVSNAARHVTRLTQNNSEDDQLVHCVVRERLERKTKRRKNLVLFESHVKTTWESLAY